jgi:PIN domain nuclease of toxin-antitoxin system
MRLLLDTHGLLWFIAGSSRLSQHVRDLIEGPENEKLVSIASLRELAIKLSLGKLDLDFPLDEFVSEQVLDGGFELLDIHVEHVAMVATLPFHHRDPFDRLLIAQSLADDLPILSADAAFEAYSVRRIW